MVTKMYMNDFLDWILQGMRHYNKRNVVIHGNKDRSFCKESCNLNGQKSEYSI